MKPLFASRVIALTTLFPLAGCASHASNQDPAASADHPANPDAPAAPAPQPFTLLKGGGPPRRAATAPASPSSGHEQDHGGHQP